MFLDVVAGPMIAMAVGIYIVLPLILVALVVLLTVRLIKKFKKKHEEDAK